MIANQRFPHVAASITEPQLDASSRAKLSFQVSRRGSIHACDKRGLIAVEETLDHRKRVDKVTSKFCVWCSAHDDDECQTGVEDRCALIRPATDALVMTDGDPATPGYFADPFLVRRIVGKVVAVLLHCHASITK